MVDSRFYKIQQCEYWSTAKTSGPDQSCKMIEAFTVRTSRFHFVLKNEVIIVERFWSIFLKGRPQFHIPSVQYISSTQKGHSFSAPKIPQFHTKNPSVQHTPLSSTPKTPQFHPLSSTPKTPQFHPPQFNTKNPSAPPPQFHSENSSVQHQKSLSSTPKIPQFHTKKSS